MAVFVEHAHDGVADLDGDDAAGVAEPDGDALPDYLRDAAGGGALLVPGRH
ncbi:hypothetical protein [Pseudonocardia petroleophila]|uniref:hypothetical protein n=1 Tax=Pseudonocardia petroleophila TaxID=37331 RepID=UPI002104AF5C|nr:hypothetical protein [Pseudonocardia petroleophila]